MGETKRENLEEEKSPEQAVKNAVAAVENKDASDPVIASEWMADAKNVVKVVGIGAKIFLTVTGKMLQSMYGFIKHAIQKKGQVGFGEGMKIGEAPFLKKEKDSK